MGKANKNKNSLKNKMRINLFSKNASLNEQYKHGYIPYSLQMNNYMGHRTVETVKECNFFGPRSEFVISGSDCGHAFIWRKSDGKIINVIKGDARITNVVQGNPVNCSLVTSGLDSTVKLFTPTSDGMCKEDENEKWDQVIEENKRESQNARRPIPMSLLVYLLRRGLYGFDTDDDDDDDDDMKGDESDNDDGDEDGNGGDVEDEATLNFLED